MPDRERMQNIFSNSSVRSAASLSQLDSSKSFRQGMEQYANQNKVVSP
jgi:hypothetical protein